MDIKTLARETSAQFEVGTRTGGEVYWKRKSDADEWIQALCFAAHEDHICGMMMPDDYRYQMIIDALNLIEEYGEEAPCYTSESAPVYDCELTDWLSSKAYRKEYVAEAVENYGSSGDLIGMMSNGYLCEFQIVIEIVVNFLSNQLESMEEETEEKACHE